MSAANIINIRRLPEGNFDSDVENSGRIEAKGFTVRGNVLGAGVRSSKK